MFAELLGESTNRSAACRGMSYPVSASVHLDGNTVVFCQVEIGNRPEDLAMHSLFEKIK